MVDMVYGDAQTFQNMGPGFGFFQIVTGTANDHFAPMVHKAAQCAFKSKQHRPVVHHSQHIDAEAGFQGREFIQGIDHNVRNHAALEVNDDADALAQTMRSAEVIVFATPIYFYEMSGQMKTLLDRTNPLFPAKYAFGGVYLLATSADGDAGSMDGAVKGLEGWISCFPPARLAGVVRGTGADEKGAIRDKAGALAEAYEMGKNV